MIIPSLGSMYVGIVFDSLLHISLDILDPLPFPSEIASLEGISKGLVTVTWMHRHQYMSDEFINHIVQEKRSYRYLTAGEIDPARSGDTAFLGASRAM